MMHANGMKALKSFIGHRTMTERSMASFDDEVSLVSASASMPRSPI
jgi:hypothetical protein